MNTHGKRVDSGSTLPPVKEENGTGALANAEQPPQKRRKKGKTYLDFKPVILETPCHHQLSEKALTSKHKSFTYT
ncbi:hypothetical protein FRB94_004589 [Tulasnella sp. JGI-2019a]|nr:hypothetical protein FRB94_004589 [Tulasnella sp. JGI-2019a]KAG8988694.1 hypothetical protein FRB93_004029 [Tulasnella sp. JGI-2019a]KAG9021486.1 hypothetical protein FRB95_002040 [Tulasnella sp. JGI-2019a]